MHKGGITDDVGDGGQRMARRVQHAGAEFSNGKRIALHKQRVPLAAIGGHLWPVINLLPQGLHLRDVLANRRRCASFLF